MARPKTAAWRWCWGIKASPHPRPLSRGEGSLVKPLRKVLSCTAVVPLSPRERGPGGEVTIAHDAAGTLVLGTTISPRHPHNLAEMGLAWHENAGAEPKFARFVAEIKEKIHGS